MSSISLDLDNEETFNIIEHFAEGLPGGFFIYHADGDEGFIYINSAMLRIFGCKTEQEFRELTKNSFHTMVHPDDIDEVEESIAQQIEESIHDLDYVEYRIIRKDGEVRWIVDYGHFVHTETHGDVFFVFIDDATDKKKLQIEAVRKTSVIEGLSNGFNSIYLVNTKDDTIMPYAWNDPISKEFVEQKFHNSLKETGYTAFNKEFAEKYVAEDDREKYLEAVDLKSVQRKIAAKEDILCVFRGGKDSLEYVQLTISPVKGATFLSVLAMKTVTEQMKKIKAEALEKLLIEQERDNAIHANNAKSAFLFNMSHDLKTPINAIAGFAELAKRSATAAGDADKLPDYLEKIKVSSNMLVELINDVLRMTEIETGNLTLSEAPCDLRSQVMLIGDVFKPQISNKDLSYSVTLKIKHNFIIADALNLKRVLSNLLQNAVNFTGEGGEIALTVTEQKSDDENAKTHKYLFSISDTGCGMSKEFMEKMYTAFEREQNTTKSQVAGTGLGLTITKNLVEAMNGTIDVESEVGKGTTFTVGIPFKVSKVPVEVADEDQNQEPEIKKAPEGKPKRLLLVEDNDLNMEIAREIVKWAGFETEVAWDGIEAVEIFKSKPENYFDLILMDIQMPRMNGYDATKAIRALPREDVKTLPIFAVTANTLESDKQRAFECGMDRGIEKPLDIDMFTDTLGEF